MSSLFITKGTSLENLLLLREAAKARREQYYEYPIGWNDGVPQHEWPRDSNRCLLCQKFRDGSSCDKSCPGKTVLWRMIECCGVYSANLLFADAWDNDRSAMIDAIIKELENITCEVI